MRVNTITTTEFAVKDGSAMTVSAPRVASIDIFRGITMAVMIFVNELAGVAATPWWTNHAPGSADYMTYVDMVFPFFLFIVGMSMPLSISQRLRKNPSWIALWRHIIARVVSLLTLGLVLANADNADAAKMGMGGSVWALLTILSAGLYLNLYPWSERLSIYVKVLRSFGLAGVVLLLAIFRRTLPGGQIAWLDFEYPEILGLIAYSYFAVSLVYVPTRRWKWSPWLLFVLFALLNLLSAARLIGGPVHWPWWLWPFSNGSMGCLIMAGMITSEIFLGNINSVVQSDRSSNKPDTRTTPQRSLTLALLLGLVLLVAGRVFTPLGISKIRATPTWTFYSAGTAVLVFALLFWICDVNERTNWAVIFRPAGANTLTTYLLPDLWYFVMTSFGLTFYDRYFNLGWTAVVKTVAFTLFILGVSTLLTRARVRLQL